MASIFRKDDNFVEEVPRNTYDMSFQNNMTTDFGSLRPCLCLPVQPGDSFKIDTTFGLRFLPMVFPIQTRMKASIHYFYVRNRNLWKDWSDFIGRTKSGLVPPYLHLTESNRKQIETSQLGDFLGLPTKVYDKVYETEDLNLNLNDPIYDSTLGWYQGTIEDNGFMALTTSQYGSITVGNDYTDYFTTATVVPSDDSVLPVHAQLMSYDQYDPEKTQYKLTFSDVGNTYVSCKLVVIGVDGKVKFVSSQFGVSASASLPYEVDVNMQFDASWFDSDGVATRRPNCLIVLVGNTAGINQINPSPVLSVYRQVDTTFDVADKALSELPWRSDGNTTGIPLSALPFRAYESIYNSFYRNAENNPLLINGVPEYNRWCRTQEGGADTNFYPIMYHNWEDDFLTTAVPSPQQGNAPLVGLSGTPTLTIGHDDGTTTTASLDVDEDGNVIAVNAQSGDEATTQALVGAVSYGITINDFRNVNAFQRWLENNIRRGYKYRDQIKTHYGVTVRYDELDMPEFIGGTSQPVMVNQISQTAPTSDSVLGDMAGQASAIGKGNAITHYCDEHGFIIGILCVKPVANYSQLLPKFFNVTDAFDYYFPEFGHIGMQPITYKEITPLQANLEGKLDDVFGYQRAWYDLISKTDEVHGLFRSDFRNFLINRTFDGTPELGKEFTVMDPNQLNEVFAVTENTDKILGQIYMDISKKTAIPLYGIPKLE